MLNKLNKLLTGLILLLLLSACSTPRPHHVANVCHIFREYPKWYWATQDVKRHWGVPISVQMAIIHQESHFNANAKPPREKLLWIIPWKRPSSAYGYSQALNQTWRGYKRSTGHGGADRNDFKDAVDFIGWYAHRAHKKLGINRNNAYQLYLAYHEGLGGYQRRTYRRKAWLMHVARKVQKRAEIYSAQLRRCQSSLKSKPWYQFWY